MTDKISSEDFIKAFGGGVKQMENIKPIMTNEEYVGYLENVRDMFIVGCERCDGDALKYQQNFISALNFAIIYIKSNLEGKEETKMNDKIKQAVKEEFMYRASQGRTNYSMEEVIQIVGEVIDEVAFEDK